MSIPITPIVMPFLKIGMTYEIISTYIFLFSYGETHVGLPFSIGS